MSFYLNNIFRRLLALTHNGLLCYSTGENSQPECTMHLFLKLIRNLEIDKNESAMIVSFVIFFKFLKYFK